MIIQNIFNSSLTPLRKQKINFNSANIKQNGIYEQANSNDNKDDDKKKLKNTYWKGVFAGVLFSVLVIGGDRLCEYLIKKNSPKFR